MGRDAGAGISIGYRIDREDLFERFSVRVEEESHLEDRFDKKTGQKLEPEKVIDEPARTVLEFDGKRYEIGIDAIEDELDGFYEALGKKLDCKIAQFGACEDGEECLWVSFCPPVKKNDDELDWGRFSVGSSIDYVEVQKLKIPLVELSERLREIGLGALTPRVFLHWYCGY